MPARRGVIGMRSDVLDVISSARDVTNAVVLTHNIDFVFVQTVVLSAFRRCGQSYDHGLRRQRRARPRSFAQQKAVLTDLGVRYRVVPVAMGTGFRFHPKAVLLIRRGPLGRCWWGAATSPSAGGARTVRSGHTSRAKPTVRAPFDAFRELPRRRHSSGSSLPEAVEREVEEALDPRTKSWMSADGEADGQWRTRWAGGKRASALLDADSLTAGGEGPVEELLVCAPYFDHDGVALQELVASVGRAPRTTVLCQAGRTALHERAWKPQRGERDTSGRRLPARKGSAESGAARIRPRQVLRPAACRRRRGPGR